MKPKAKKAPAWSHEAKPEVAEAILRLLAARDARKQAEAEFREAQQIIIKGNGGAAHGVRAAIRHIRAQVTYRRITVKARTFVTILDGVEQ